MIRFFEIDLPVVVRSEGRDTETRRLTVRVVLGESATAQQAVEELARKLEHYCNTTDIGDEE